jgi:hypothetical protein
MAPQPPGALADTRVAVTCLSPVPAGAPFPCAVSILGGGDAPPPLLIRVELPLGMLHVFHDAGGRLDADARTVTFRFSGAPDAPRTFRVELIADDAAAGTVPPVVVTMGVDGGRDPGERYAAASVAVERRSQVDLGVVVLPITSLTLFVLMAMSLPACLGIVWILRRKRRALVRAPRRPGYPPVLRDTVMAPAFFAVLCALALAAAAPAAVESVRVRTTFAETRCTVLDRARSGSPFGDTDDLVSMAALRYDTPAGSRVSLGFDARGTLERGGSASAHEDFTVGHTYPCWFDPERPSRVVLRRGPTGVALLAVPLAIGMLRLAAGLRRAWRA